MPEWLKDLAKKAKAVTRWAKKPCECSITGSCRDNGIRVFFCEAEQEQNYSPEANEYAAIAWPERILAITDVVEAAKGHICNLRPDSHGPDDPVDHVCDICESLERLKELE